MVKMTSKVRTVVVSVMAAAMGACGSDTGFEPVDSDLFVVQGYLYAGEPIADFSVTGVLPIDADSTDVAPAIADAQIRLIKDGTSYALIPTEGEPGRYRYPGNDLEVVVGDTFQMEATWGGRTATAETVVPPPPTGLVLSSDSLIAPDFSGGFGPGGGGAGALQNRIVATWNGGTQHLHFVVVDNIESDPVILPTTEIFTRFAPRFVQQPTPADSAFVQVLSLTHYGIHRLRLYSINDEYTDLYEGLTQDSRDLNEPPSNVDGALGVFSAFSADSAFFEVR